MTPARLHRKEEKESSISQYGMNIEAWVLSHASLCLCIAISLLIALFVVLIFTLTGVSATESGTVYNQFNNIV